MSNLYDNEMPSIIFSSGNIAENIFTKIYTEENIFEITQNLKVGRYLCESLRSRGNLHTSICINMNEIKLR